MPIPKRVFVLGAGFTKAFLPDAPVITDNYDKAGKLEEAFRGFPYAYRLLSLERGREEGGNMNLERLMSRLESGMPYDDVRGLRSELEHLQDELKAAFLRRFEGLEIAENAADELITFAAYCIVTRAHCITFNYDDVFDWALTRAGYRYPNKQALWVRQTGYGIRLLASEPTRAMDSYLSGGDFIYLLKLHGSFNWRIRTGHRSPYVPEAIEHHEAWAESDKWRAVFDQHPTLQRQPFIVPPVMAKSAIMEEPVLRTVWTRSFEVLEKAEEVVFLGYSLPTTDLAARVLFAEAVPLSARIDVVVKSRFPDKVKRIEEEYMGLLGKKRPRIVAKSAQEYIRDLLVGWEP